MRSKVTTKRGDQGTTTALDGETYCKAHPIMHCVGAVDEARAQIALLQLVLAAENEKNNADILRFLHWILHTLFLIGTECSDPCKKHPEYRRGRLGEQELRSLEKAQMELEAELDLPSAFIVSASTIPAAHADLSCTAVRRLEREFAALQASCPEFETGTLPAYLNRLSDYLYILARWLEAGKHIPMDYSRLEPPEA